MKSLPIEKINKLLGTRHKKADPKAERRKQMRERKIDMKFIVIAFAAVVVILAVVSAVIVLSEKNNTSVSQPDENAAVLIAADTSGEEKPSDNRTELNANILLALTEDGNSGLELLSVINLDSVNGKVRISYIPTETMQSVNNLTGTMAEHIENGGIKELLWAVGEHADISIERYVCLDEANFADIMKKIGEFEVRIDEDISHEYNGISFIIDEGTHRFASDAMLKYVVYLCQMISTESKTLTDIMAGIAGKLISDEKGNKITAASYDKAVNCVDTDISAIDIVNYSQAIAGLFDSGALWNVEIEPQTSKLKSE